MWNRKANRPDGDNNDEGNDSRTDDIATKIGEILLKLVVSLSKKLYYDFVCAAVASALQNSETGALRLIKVQALHPLIDRVMKSRAQVPSYELLQLLRNVNVDEHEKKKLPPIVKKKSNYS